MTSSSDAASAASPPPSPPRTPPPRTPKLRWHSSLCKTTTILPWHSFTPFVQETLKVLRQESPALTDLLCNPGPVGSIPLLAAAETLLLLLHQRPPPQFTHNTAVTPASFYALDKGVPAPRTHDKVWAALSVQLPWQAHVAAHVVRAGPFSRSDGAFWGSCEASASTAAHEVRRAFARRARRGGGARAFADAVTGAVLCVSGCTVAVLPGDAVVCMRLARSGRDGGLAVRVSRVFRRDEGAGAATAALLWLALRRAADGGQRVRCQIAAARVAPTCARAEGAGVAERLVGAGGEVVAGGRGEGAVAVRVRGEQSDVAVVCWDGACKRAREDVQDAFARVAREGWGDVVGEVLVVDLARAGQVCNVVAEDWRLGRVCDHSCLSSA